MNGVGAHEVLIESRHHEQSLGELPVAEVERLLCAMRERILDLAKDKRLRHIVPFKNHGTAAGASQPHPHSQLIALPVVPSAVIESLEGTERHFRMKERCIFCDIVRQELADGRRLVYQNAHAVVIAPFASRFPFELQILPRAHAGRFEQCEPATLSGIADAARVAVRRLSVALEDAPYNLTVRSAPLSAPLSNPMYQPELSHYHWHVEIVPTLTKVAGFELGSGCAINPTPPEDAAAFLREISA
jgi:UDPglucose--hexose-1-phosphate uridylyltransferase